MTARLPKDYSLPNPSRVRKTPVTCAVVSNGIYRIASAIRGNDNIGFFELQEDNTTKVVALDEASNGQKVPSPLAHHHYASKF